jgi:hypothetical protein
VNPAYVSGPALDRYLGSAIVPDDEACLLPIRGAVAGGGCGGEPARTRGVRPDRPGVAVSPAAQENQ